MLSLISTVLAGAAVLTCVLIVVISRQLIHDFRQVPPVPLQSDAELPPAAVILCVRGADPTLSSCLNGLMSQQYPDFEVHIVLDNDLDPAADVVRQIIKQSTGLNVEVHILETPDPARGLKVSAILQALEAIPKRFRMIAFLDADTAPYPFWLRDLVQPLQSPEVGATSGIRWFVPEVSNLGSLIRAKWNLYAVALMRNFNIAWGGSFAIRRDIIERSNLLNRWSETLCEDTCIGDTLADAGYQVRLVPEASMINGESTTIAGCHRFITRQLIFTRLYSRGWTPILLFGLGLSVISILIPFHLVLTLLNSDLTAFAVTAATMSSFIVGISLLENRIARLAAVHGQHGEAIRIASPTGVVGAVFRNYICQMACVCVSGAAFVNAAFARRLEWRGIVYRLRRSRVTLVQYQPFVPVVETDSKLRGISI